MLVYEYVLEVVCGERWLIYEWLNDIWYKKYWLFFLGENYLFKISVSVLVCLFW